MNFTLNLTQQQLEFKSINRQIKFAIKTCSASTFSNFSKKIRSEIKTDITKSEKKVPKTIQAALDREIFYLIPLSPSAILLSKIETEIDYLISEAHFRCSKK